MIQYKFRGKRKDWNKWVYGSLIVTPTGTFILEEGDSIDPVELDYHANGMGCGLEDQNITDRYEAMRHGFECAVEKMAEFFPYFIEVIPETVGICFGWVDSDSNDIYTGDRLELTWKNGDVTCEIISYSSEYGYYMYGSNPICELVESDVKSKIVGNTHEVIPLADSPALNTMNNLQDPGTKQAEEVKNEEVNNDLQPAPEATEPAEGQTTEG